MREDAGSKIRADSGGNIKKKRNILLTERRLGNRSHLTFGRIEKGSRRD